jgi:thiamine biosynthesis lipoprotein
VTATASFPALGTTAQVVVEEPTALPRALSVMRRELAAIDRTCSRFRSDSELRELGRADGRPFAATPLLLEAVEAALHVAAATDGDVDPTVGASLAALGWDRDFRRVLARSALADVRLVPARSWRCIRVDRRAGTIQLPAGVELDLGASAKALAADRCAQAAQRATGSATLVNLGGDIAVAGAPAGGWTVRVCDDHRSRDAADGQTIALHAGGLATSSTTVRRWRTGSGAVHHIVDPRTGAPAREAWRTVSVTAASCLDANAASTAAIVRGRRASAWLGACGLPARLVTPAGDVTRVAGWPEAAA